MEGERKREEEEERIGEREREEGWFIFPVIKNSNSSRRFGYYSQSSINYRPEWLSLSGSFIRGGHYAEVGPKKGRKKEKGLVQKGRLERSSLAPYTLS